MNGRVVLLTTTTLVAMVMAAAAPLVRVTGTVERVVHPQGRCGGGVAITHEQLAEEEARAQHLPLADATFTVFAGDQRAGKPVMRFKTERSARFDIRLAEGVFCIMGGEYAEVAPENPAGPLSSPSPHVDGACLRDMALRCDTRLVVRKGMRDVKLTMETFTPCPQQWAQPCWRGPMPP